MSSIPTIRHCVIVWMLGMYWAVPCLTFGYEPALPQLAEKHHPELLAISSDKEAINFFKTKLQLELQLTQDHTRHNRKTSRQPSAPEPTDDIVTLITNLLASRIAVHIQTTTQQARITDIHRFTDEQLSPQKWLRTKPLPTSMTTMASFITSFSHYFKTFTPLPNRPRQFDAFAQYVDQHYPELTGSADSWVGLLEQGNIVDISKRLSEYWERGPSQGKPLAATSGQDNADINSYAHYYYWTRLFPIFKAHLIALAIQAEAETLQLAKLSLSNIEKVRKAKTTEHNKVRLCGTWHWTVHNHQNHGDHKMTVFFGDSNLSPANQPQPTEMIINGNTVYLLWKFSKGYQEDSLILSHDDKRLEGTFKNTLGPHGSITGKRISSCKS